MERAFIFDKYNTYYDWDLILTAKEITPPDPKTNLIELDGVNGSLDLSEALSGEVVYRDRTLTASFWTDKGDFYYRVEVMKKITALLHGKKVKIIEPDSPAHYLYGRIKIKNFTNNRAYMSFDIEATCEPWKYSIEESSRSVTVNGQAVDIVIHNNGVKTLCPSINVTGAVSLTIDGVTTALTEGGYMITNLKLKTGANVVGISGNGSVTLTYREADL